MNAIDANLFDPSSFTDIANAAQMFERFPHYEQVLRWIEGFVLKPDRRLHRPGAVCPRLAPTIERNLVRLVTVKTTAATLAEAVEKIPHLADLYIELFGQSQALLRGGVLLAIFPDVDPDDAAEFIDGGHAAVRVDFVRRGLMLGEFHTSSSVGSVHNPTFPVMQSPVPMFAVRALTVHDILFLDRPGEHRAELLGHYLDLLGDQIPTQIARRVERTLETIGH
ncbi:DUF6875 domain-containing protein [Nocardia sp. NPDC049707]|uniref:DUF6875 domain-containing protein n=1 Tax=Nocardia sp. NPDC049707 TaxID=3154735 RepID=UPI0034346267